MLVLRNLNDLELNDALPATFSDLDTLQTLYVPNYIPGAYSTPAGSIATIFGCRYHAEVALANRNAFAPRVQVHFGPLNGPSVKVWQS